MTLDRKKRAVDAFCWAMGIDPVHGSAGRTNRDIYRPAIDAAITTYLSTAPTGQVPLEGVKLLMDEAEYYGTRSGQLDGIPFQHVSRICRVMAERIRSALLPASSEPVAHDLYKTGDADAPDGIKDRNGEIALGACRRCGGVEADLDGPCIPPASGAVEAVTHSHPYEDWRKAINFAIETDEPQAFLKCWSHGEWDVLDNEWPEWGTMFPAAPTEGR